MVGRPLVAVIVAGAVTAGAAAFALGRGVASDSSSSTTGAGAEPTPASASAVTIKDFAFSPDTITIKAGTGVTWTNNDSATHSVLSVDGSYASQNLGQGQTYSHTFSAPGKFPYVCGIHNFMTATIVVESG